jgi:polyisoprenyl-phosphate glycosyltransferase
VPLLNEEAVLPAFFARIEPILAEIGISYEMVFVDDGSTDRTSEILREKTTRDDRIRLIEFSRNFGKEAALTAGLEWASGAAVVPIDVDLQDPPELIAEFVRLWREGYEVIYGKRVSRSSDTELKRKTAGTFYKIFNRIAEYGIEENVGDFRLMSRPVVDATLRLRERNRFMKGLFAWVGFRAIAVEYERPQRAAGATKFNYLRLWNFALDGITSFSTVPLRIWTYLGVMVGFAAFVFMIVVMAQTLILGRDVPGYASLMVVVLFLGGIQLISLGIIGEYLGRIYLESKQRPIYIMRDAVGFEPAARQFEPERAAHPDSRPADGEWLEAGFQPSAGSRLRRTPHPAAAAPNRSPPR